MGDMAGLPRIPQLHGRLFATRILIVLRSSAFRFPSTEIPTHGLPAERPPVSRGRKGLFDRNLSLV
jgi:hypothetical protein